MLSIQHLIIAALVVAGLGWFFLNRQRTAAAVGELGEAAVVVDVRSAGEFAAGHVQGALHFPVERIGELRAQVGHPDLPIVVYCASGGRSAHARQALLALGFTRVVNAGGLGAAARALGRPITRD